jgi:hypothetical protein
MIISFVLVLVASLVLLFLARLARGQAMTPHVAENLGGQIRSVDVDAFRNLIDPDEEDYLRNHLHPAEFRRIQRERVYTAVEYILAAAHNAAVLLRWGEAARQSSDPTVAAMAERLINDAIRLRLYAFQAIPRLYVAMLLPVRRLSPVRVVDRYEQITRQVVLLGLRYPMGGASSGF